MANQRVTDLDPIVTLPDSGIIHVVDTTNNAQDAAGSSFKITKANLLKENTAAILLNTNKVGITTTQATAIINNTSKVGYTDALVAAAPTVAANTLKVGITPAQTSAISLNTANTSKVSVNTDAASLANVRSLRYREETYSSNIDMVMQTNVGVYNWSTIFSVAFNIANAIIERFKTRVATDGGTFEAQALTESGLNSIATLNLATFVMTANSFKLSKIYAAFPNLSSSDFTFARNSTGSRINSAGNREVVAINTPIINYPVSGAAPELLLEPQRTNLLLNSDVLVTQSITTTAAAHALSFTGTGTVTLSGTFSGSLVGTGANNVVSLGFTPTAGTLTVTISGSCTLGQIEVGVTPTANIPTINAAVTRVSPLSIIVSDLITKGITTATQGTIFLKLGLCDNSTSSVLLNLSTLTNQTTERIAIVNATGSIRTIVSVGGVSVVNYTQAISPNNSNIAITFLNGIYKIFINGAIRFTSSAVTQNAYTSLQLTDSNAGNIISATRSIKSLLLYNTALTDAQAITITT